MPAKQPEEINDLFPKYIRAGDLDGALALYDTEVAFANQAGEVKRGPTALREELAPFAEAKADFRFTVTKVIRTGDLALVHNRWEVSSPQPRSGYAIEVARRQPDGTWRWVIGDPFTVGSAR